MNMFLWFYLTFNSVDIQLFYLLLKPTALKHTKKSFYKENNIIMIF